MRQNLYLQVLEWAFNKTPNGFTEEELFKSFNIVTSEQRGWYLTTFRNSSNGNQTLIESVSSTVINRWHLTEKGITNAVEYIELREALKSGKRATCIAILALIIGILTGLAQVYVQICTSSDRYENYCLINK
jgi:hypothetical protein